MVTGKRSPTLCLRARGELAVFSRPELKTERMSYLVMTPSAARGLLEAVLWKPAIVWIIERIMVLSPIRFCAFRRNEVTRKAALAGDSLVAQGGPGPAIAADDSDVRAQRNTVALRDVDYIVEAHFEMTDKAGSDDNVKKFTSMFERRVNKGQAFHQPYFGCREFPARIEPVGCDLDPIDDTRDLGMMLLDIDYSREKRRAVYFQARLESGVLNVPRDPALLYTSLEDGGAP